LSNREGSHPPIAGKKNPPHLRCEGLFLAEREGFASPEELKLLYINRLSYIYFYL